MRVGDAAFCIELHFFVQCRAHRHGHPAHHRAADLQRIDHLADIEGRSEMVDQDLAGLLLDADFGRLGAKGVGDAHAALPVLVRVGVARQAGIRDGLGQLADGDAVAGDVTAGQVADRHADAGVVAQEDILPVVIQVILVGLQHLGGGLL